MCNFINKHTLIQTHTHVHTHTQVSLMPPLEDQCQWHRVTKMTRPDYAVTCNLVNTQDAHTHAHTHIPFVAFDQRFS